MRDLALKMMSRTLLIAICAHVTSAAPKCQWYEPENCGDDANQGQWGTCALYATCAALRAKLRDKYHVVMRPVNEVVDALKMNNFGCGPLGEVADKGTDENQVLELMNKQMENMRLGKDKTGWGPFTKEEKQLQFMAKVPIKEEGWKMVDAHITFRIKYKGPYKTPEELCEKCQNPCKLSHTVVIGHRVTMRTTVKGAQWKWEQNHRYHAMQGNRYNPNTKSLFACNSWGKHNQSVEVGRPDVGYPDFKAGWIFHIRDMHYRLKNQKWKPLDEILDADRKAWAQKFGKDYYKTKLDL